MRCDDCGATRKTVKLCQGDLNLCKKCESTRFPSASPPKMAAKGEQSLPHPDVSKLDTIQETLLELTSKVESFADVQTKLANLQKSVTYVCDFFEDFKTQLISLKNENKDLRTQLARTQVDLNDLQQYTRRNNIEIKGIPVMEDEDTDDIVIKVASSVGVEITRGDIDISHRLPSRSTRHDYNQLEETRHSTIIAKFTRRTVRNKIYSSRKYLKNKTTNDIVNTGSNPIYLNQNLTSLNKQLFYSANQRRKAAQYRYIWTNAGKIYVRKAKGEPVISITQLSDIHRIM
ncbi:uncharacterized protein LOC144353384 [Saccoglossus kowalevskii]